MIFDDTPCILGEGPLWHPDRNALIWFDILAQRMFLKPLEGVRQHWDFTDPVSAAGIVDADRIVVASSRALMLVDLRDGSHISLAALEADTPMTRSNDGRADPQGGFWISTMGRNGQPGAGAIWRYYRGQMRRLYQGLTTPNAICFSPEGNLAHFADTPRGLIWQVLLDCDGWPIGDPRPFLDLSAQGLNPDGAVIDTEGGLWSAQWGAGRVVRYDRAGQFDRAVALPVRQVSCPAFGGPGLGTLFVTSARQGLDNPGAEDGCTFALPAGATGQSEYRVLPG